VVSRIAAAVVPAAAVGSADDEGRISPAWTFAEDS
jgi:hypothetical protein